jgi:EF hand
MRALAFMTALLFAAPAAAQRGVVSGIRVSTERVSAGAPVTMSITGSNPCGAVLVDQGDGTAVTHPIERVPTTIRYAYSQPGTYRITARGMGNCDGEAAATVTVVGPLVQEQSSEREPVQLRGMDVDGDGVITRAEWRGSAQAFRAHDWNGDGLLSGNEVRGDRPSGTIEDRYPAPGGFSDWTEEGFAELDRNGDGRIARSEWRNDLETFRRVDRNGDGVLSRREFLGEGVAEDQDLRASGQMVVVDARRPWNDTGLVVREGDRVRIEAEGTVMLSTDPSDVAGPVGARSGRKAAGAPFPEERAGSLVARIGAEPIWIGDTGIIARAPAGGRLYLGVNDDFFPDNSGSFRVTLTIMSRYQ